MKDTHKVDFNSVVESLVPPRAYRLSDVEHRLERVAYDLVRFRDNQDTDQLWKVEDRADGPVIVALYGDDGSQSNKSDATEKQGSWEAIPDKKAMHIYYKGEPLVSLSSDQLGIPVDEFNIARRWLPAKLAGDESLQELLLEKVAPAGRKLIAQRFPELTKVAGDWEDEMDDAETDRAEEFLGESPLDDWPADEMELQKKKDKDSWAEDERRAEELGLTVEQLHMKEMADDDGSIMQESFEKDLAILNDPNSSFEDLFGAIKRNYTSDPEAGSNISRAEMLDSIKAHDLSADELKKILDWVKSDKDRVLADIVGPLDTEV